MELDEQGRCSFTAPLSQKFNSMEKRKHTLLPLRKVPHLLRQIVAKNLLKRENEFIFHSAEHFAHEEKIPFRGNGVVRWGCRSESLMGKIK